MQDQVTYWTLDKLLGHRTSGSLPALAISGLNLDSRLVTEGDLYLALGGSTTHGIHFVADAVAAGAVAVAISTDAIKQYADKIQEIRALEVPIVSVDRLELQVAEIASQFYQHPDYAMTLIAVTGTDGKTSVCRFISQAFSSLELPCGYIGTLGWGLGESLLDTQLTTPDAVTLRRVLATLRDEGAKYVALEASSHGLAEGRLLGLNLDIAVLTNFGRDHLDYHGSLDAYKAAKLILFEWPSVSTWIVNENDELGRQLCEATPKHSINKLAFAKNESSAKSESIAEAGVRSNGLQVVASNINLSADGVSFDVSEQNETGFVRSHLLGQFNVDNLLACYCCLRACGVAANDARHAIEKVQPINGRMERFQSGAGPTAVVDYCHTPQALALALEALRVHCPGNLWVVFGCGGDRDKGKRAPMAVAAEAADRIIVTDDNPRHEHSNAIIEDVMKGFSHPEAVLVIPDRRSAIHYAVESADVKDWILVAGKGHESYQIIGDVRYQLSDTEEVKAALGGVAS